MTLMTTRRKTLRALSWPLRLPLRAVDGVVNAVTTGQLRRETKPVTGGTIGVVMLVFAGNVLAINYVNWSPRAGWQGVAGGAAWLWLITWSSIGMVSLMRVKHSFWRGYRAGRMQAVDAYLEAEKRQIPADQWVLDEMMVVASTFGPNPPQIPVAEAPKL